MKLTPRQSLAGVLEPVFSIRTEEDIGIGDTEGMRQMIDWCARHRLSIFQTLPINETGDDNSPYNAISSQAIDPTTIAITPAVVSDLLPGKFAELAPPKLVADLRAGAVDYPRVKALKRALLEAAFERFHEHHFNHETPRALQFRSFLMENADWLSDYALFRVLMEENGHSPAWEQWAPEHRSPRSARTWLLSLPERRCNESMRRQLFYMYVQWLAFGQWQALKAHASTHKVYLMGDIPFGVGRSSADVWANRDIFDLDWSGGAPPETLFKGDPFTEKWGQNWGIPNYRWDELRRRNFDWWRMRVGNIQKVFHLYRIDHALGFFRIYSFPWPPTRNSEFLPLTEEQAAARTGGRLPGFKRYPDDTSEHKAANRGQGEELLRMVQEASGDTTVVAEDLGVVPEYVAPTLEKLALPGFRIPAFFRGADGRYSDPKQYPRLSLAQPATHDHAPLAATWAEHWQNIDAGRAVDSHRRELRLMMEFAGLGGVEPAREFTDQLHEAYMRAVLQSASWLVVFQITDIFGMTARFNTPGAVAQTNWSQRLPNTVSDLDATPSLLRKTELFSRLVQESGRVG